jgi:prepilin-type N-terminal cleavage/methylation domain-containing protein
MLVSIATIFRTPRLPRAVRARLADDSGFTLIELLVVSTILAFVLAAILAPFEFAQTETPKNVEYAKAISEASTGLQRVMRDVREAYRIDSTTPNSIDFNAVLNSKDLEIYYECDIAYPTNTGDTHAGEYHRCVRVSATTGSALPPISQGAVVIDRLLNGTAAAPVFTFKDSKGNLDPTNPTYIEAKIQVPALGSLNAGLKHTIELQNGTTVPNLALP